jgi:hypothetical protein
VSRESLSQPQPTGAASCGNGLPWLSSSREIQGLSATVIGKRSPDRVMAECASGRLPHASAAPQIGHCPAAQAGMPFLEASVSHFLIADMKCQISSVAGFK